MKVLLRLLLLPLLLAATGCDHRDLCYDHRHYVPVSLEFDWSEAPEAAPESMVVWFFPADGSQGVRYELFPGGGSTRSSFDAQIKVPPGVYRVLCHNGSTDNNIEEGATFDDYRLTTFDDGLLSAPPPPGREGAPRPGLTADEPVKAPSSEIWAHTFPKTVALEKGETEAVRVRFVPRQAHETWHIKITGVENLTPDMEVSAIVTGVAESWSPAREGCSGAEVTVPFAMRHCGTDCLRADVTLFGDNAPHDVRHCLRLYTSCNYYYDFDITDQVHAAAVGEHDIDITLSGLRLHNPGTGMSPGVSDWVDSEDQELKM